jgi:hypothetical protein
MQLLPSSYSCLHHHPPCTEKETFKWIWPCLRSNSHFWHQTFRRSVSLRISHNVFMVIMHNFSTSHGISTFVGSCLRGSISPTKISSQVLRPSYNEHFVLRSLKWFQVSIIAIHFMNPCSIILKIPSMHMVQIPSYLILVLQVPMGRPPIRTISHIIVKIFLGNHRYQMQ